MTHNEPQVEKKETNLHKSWPQKPPNKGKLVPGTGEENVEGNAENRRN